jgi:hypothetical protein
MRLIRKIKSYYTRHDFYLWRDKGPDPDALSFSEPGDEALMDMGVMIREHLSPAAQPGNTRHRLHPGAAMQLPAIDDVLIFLQAIISEDLKETKAESGLYNWAFRYHFGFHPNCADTLTVSTILKSDARKGYCVYHLASVQLFNGMYYGWNQLR